jgi:hypothetical protein
LASPISTALTPSDFFRLYTPSMSSSVGPATGPTGPTPHVPLDTPSTAPPAQPISVAVVPVAGPVATNATADVAAATLPAKAAKGRPPAWNATCKGMLMARQVPYVRNLNDTRRGDLAAKARNKAINTELIDELGHACGWVTANLYAVGPDGKRRDIVKQEPVDVSKLDYAAQQVHEGRVIAWRRLLREVRRSLHEYR